MRKGVLLVLVTVFLMFAAIPARAADAAWTASYWNNMRLNGSPAMTRSETSINHDWKGRSPASGTVNADRFSVRWMRTASFAAGRYLFRATSDDGMRVWVDGRKIIDQWNDHPLQTIVVPLDITAGNHAIRVEYYENEGDAVAILGWSAVSSNPWKVQYYNVLALKGSAVTRYENVVKYHWNTTRPAPGIKVNNFSARWTHTQALSAGKHRFKVTASGGFRLYLDDELILDEWYTHGGSPSTVKVWVSGGDHSIRLEYFNRSKPAMLVLGIK